MSRNLESDANDTLRETIHDPGPVTREELRNGIEKLVVRAHANGVEINDGRYELRQDDPDIPDWEVDIWQLPRPGEFER